MRTVCIGVLITATIALLLTRLKSVAASHAPLAQGAFIWQRQWTGGVKAAVREHGSAFDQLVPLVRQVSFVGLTPHLIRVGADWAALQQTRAAVAAAVRIGPYRGPFDPETPASQAVQLAVAEVVALHPSEVQLDFDCPTAHLAGYAQWIRMLHQEFPGTRLIITALPAWLEAAQFADLLRAADGFVLQVHSLEKPTSPTALPPLCDLARTRKWIRQAAVAAADARTTFRLALPTYSYSVAFSLDGSFLGLSAEDEKPFPTDATVMEVSPDAAGLAELVHELQASHPEPLVGILWYRLPTAEDEHNWPFTTLQAVMAGHAPAGKMRLIDTPTPSGAHDLALENVGDGDAAVPATVATPAAETGDGLNQWQFGPTSFVSTAARPMTLRAGAILPLGWIRPVSSSLTSGVSP